MRTPRIGIDLGGTKIEGVVLSPLGKIQERIRVVSPRENYTALLAAVIALVRRLDNHINAATGNAFDACVGIGTPGAWQATAREMKNCNSTMLNGRPLLDDLRAALGDRVRLANDANCFALSEAADGAGCGADVVFGVILGTGVGGGIVVAGQPLVGPNSSAGEWGHTPLPYLRHAAPADGSSIVRCELWDLQARLADRLCYCGRYNCIETFLSGPGLARTIEELCIRKLSAKALFAATDADLVAVRGLYCDMLARSLAQIINILDPDVVVLGGGLSAQAELYERVPQLWQDYLFSPDNCTTKLRPPAHGDSSGVRGAAWLWPAVSSPPFS